MSRAVLVGGDWVGHSPGMTCGKKHQRWAWVGGFGAIVGTLAACASSELSEKQNAAGDTNWLGPDEGGQTGAIVPSDLTEAEAGPAPMAATDDALAAPDEAAAQGTNINLSGSQDFGPFRAELAAGRIPSPDLLDEAGFFAEHHGELPPPSCGEQVCLQTMLAVMGNLLDGSNCTMLQLGLNSPLTINPANRPPLTLAVVVDVSGSMQGDKLAYTQQGLELLIDGLSDGDRFALISYSNNAAIVSELGDVQGRRAELREAVRGLVADGGTNLAEGLEVGYQSLLADYDGSRQNRVILLSDGLPTQGVTAIDTILTMSRGYNSDGLGLTTVGLGLDFNIELMRGLALQADGNFYFLENPGAVSEVFGQELSYFTVPVAFDLELELETGSAYSFGRALGSPFWRDSARGGRLEVPTLFLAHRESHDDVTDDGGRRGGGSALLVEIMPEDETAEAGSTVATVNVRFRRPDGELVEDVIDVTYPHKPGELLREGFFDAPDISAVQKSFVMLNIFVGMENAVLAFYSSTADRSTIAELDVLIASVEDYNLEIEDTDIEFDLELLRQLRANLIANGVPSGEVEVPENPWPAD